MDYEVYDNFLAPETADEIERICLEGATMPMFYQVKVAERKDPVKLGTYYFTHVIYHSPGMISSEHFATFCDPILSRFPHRALMSAVANFVPVTLDGHMEHGSHLDQIDEDGNLIDHTVLIYYVNTNNGYTRLGRKDSEESITINCVKNRLLKFDGSIYHNSATATDVNLRCVLNFNIIE
jgi:hypothetical protein